jgi:RNA polymerase-binding protein DksA
MQKKALASFKTKLLEMRRRLVEEVGHIEETIIEDNGGPRELSSLPTHNADHDSEGVDVQITLAQNEEGILEQVEAALGRIEDGSFGKCQNCGKEIASARLDALPYTAYCIHCAGQLQQA